VTEPQPPDPNEIIPGMLGELRRQARVWKRVLGRALEPPTIPGEEVREPKGGDEEDRPLQPPKDASGKVLPDQTDGR
jgi:hypothetical protein